MFGKIAITNFALMRHFDAKASGTKITDKTPQEFIDYLNLRVTDTMTSNNGNQPFKVKVMDGYAPFCKLIGIENFTNARVGTMKIDMANYQYLRSGYSSRTPSELPVFSRWFELPIPAPKADYLVVVLYSREQLLQEHEADMKKKFDNYEASRNKNLSDTDKDAISSIEGVAFELTENDQWGVVAILGQTHPNEEPMSPITMMRNALGKEEGGSGVALNKEKYLESVAFWKEHAIVKS